MNNDSFRGFVHLAESWHATTSLAGQDYDDEITVGVYYRSGGCKGEFAIRWQHFGRSLAAHCLHVWHDSWCILPEFQDLLVEMSKLNDRRISPKEFCELLKRLSIEDTTKRSRR